MPKMGAVIITAKLAHDLMIVAGLKHNLQPVV